jgi:sugar-specific transcriptional regulator TrmB
VKNLEEAISTLKDLGLTNVQAKIYLALTKSTTINVAAISKLSNIQRTDLYRALRELEEKGLVEREITHPISYKAVSLKEGVSTLLGEKEKKHSKLRKKAKKLRKKSTFIDYSAADEQAKFTIVPKLRVPRRISKAITQTEESINLVISRPSLLKRRLFFSTEIEKARSKGVKWRYIVDKSCREEPFLKQLARLKEDPSCKIATLDNLPKTIIGIYDQKQVLVFENATDSIGGSAALWSNNESLVSIMTDYFERLWLAAEKFN